MLRAPSSARMRSCAALALQRKCAVTTNASPVVAPPEPGTIVAGGKLDLHDALRDPVGERLVEIDDGRCFVVAPRLGNASDGMDRGGFFGRAGHDAETSVGRETMLVSARRVELRIVSIPSPRSRDLCKTRVVGQEAERVVGLGARSATCAVARVLIWRLEPASQVRPAAARRRLNAMAIRSTCKRFAASPR